MSADEVIDHYKHHPSIKLINDLTPVNDTTTKKKLKSLQTNKASGFDNIPPKFLINFQNKTTGLLVS